MTFLGVDYGRSHVGVAVGDTDAKMAFPHKTFHGLPRVSVLEELRTLIRINSAHRVIVGIPRGMHGEEGTLEREVREFAQQLRMIGGVPVQLMDERFTSDAAGKLRRDNPSADEHALAAMLILQSYFDTSL